jgi:hypothetical protein
MAKRKYDQQLNAGTRGIKGYLEHQKKVVFSRRKLGQIISALALTVKTKKKFESDDCAS